MSQVTPRSTGVLLGAGAAPHRAWRGRVPALVKAPSGTPLIEMLSMGNY